MTQILKWILFGIFLTPPCVALAQTNLVPNPSFELDDGDHPSAWKFSSWEAAEGRRDSTLSFHEKHSARISGMNGGWSTEINLKPGVYRLSFRYRVEGGPGKIVGYVRGSSKTPILYSSKPAITAEQQSEFIDGQFVEGADPNGWVFHDAGSFVVRDEVRDGNILIKLVTENPGVTAWLDEVIVVAEPEEMLPETSAVLLTAPGASIWTENENRKILRDQKPPDERTQEAIFLDLAQGEFGVFQIAVSPETKWESVHWKWDNFPAPLECRRIEHIFVENPIKPFGLAGWNPDPLTQKLPCDIPAGTTQAFWFTWKCPDDQSAGLHEAEVTLHAGGQEIGRIPVRIRIRNFAIPKKSRLDTYSRVHFSLLNERDKGSADEIAKRYYASYFENRTRCSPASNVGVRFSKEGEVTIQADRFIEELQYQRDQYGAHPFFIPALWIAQEEHKMPPDAKWKGIPIFADESLSVLAPEFTRTFSQFLTQLVDRLKSDDLFHEPIIRFIDEPNLSHQASVNAIKTLANYIKMLQPEISISLTGTVPHPDLFSSIDHWVLHTDAWDRALPNITKIREAGAKVSVYNNGVAYLEQEPIRLRLFPWLFAKHDVDGSYSWPGTTAWKNEMENPWTNQKSYFEVMFYPPRNNEEQGPIESVRWELFRQGLQDYEYLMLARDLAAKLRQAGDIEKAEVGEKAVEEALALVQRWPRVQPANDRPYNRDVTALTRAKLNLADAIEAMSR